jgi:hypothetical protein
VNAFDGMSHKEFTSSLRNVDREGGRHPCVVNDTGRRYPERRKSVRVRLMRRDSLGPDELEPVDSVQSSPIADFGEPLELAFADCNDELAG